jgi:hypothetical protein
MARISISSRSTHYGIEYRAAPNGWEAVKVKRQAVWPGRLSGKAKRADATRERKNIETIKDQ